MKNIIFEDDYILAINKPFGMLSQMDKKINDDNLYTQVCKYLPKNHNIGLVNRLDRGVGGIVVFSKNEKSSKHFAKIMQNNAIDKHYISVVYGDVKNDAYLVDWLLKNQRLNISKVVCKNNVGSKEARLYYKNLATKNINDSPYSLLDINLETGRHHQIRAQLSNKNIFIYGDTKYSKKREKPVGYIALFCYKMGFKHPISNQYIDLKAKPEYNTIQYGSLSIVVYKFFTFINFNKEPFITKILYCLFCIVFINKFIKSINY